MSTVAKKPALTLLRRLLSELRHNTPNGKLVNNLSANYILEQYRKYQTTDELLCKAREEMAYAAKTYLTYLESTRKQQEINIQYAGRGERSVRDTSNIVGFKLPHDPK